MWRIAVLFFVLIFLALAYYEYFWRFHFLKTIFEFFGFDGPRASASEQTAHFLAGMTIFALFNLFFQMLLGRPIVENADSWIYVLAALCGGVKKEIAEFVWFRLICRVGKWSLRDTLTDIFFWMLGGLTAPLLKMYL